MKQILRYSLLALLAMVCGNAFAEDNTDELTASTFNISGGSSYADFSGSGTSGASYAIQAMSTTDYIQIRSKNNNSGVVVTSSAGTIKSITIAYNAAKTASNASEIDVYAKNTAYTAPSDLYGDNAGEKIGQITASSASLSFTGSYSFFGIRSTNGTRYIDKITVVWETGGSSDTRTATTIELANGYVTKATPGKDEMLALPIATVKAGDATVGEATVTWTSSNESLAKINGNNIELTNPTDGGIVTIKAAYAGDATYKESSASYKLSIYKGYFSLAAMLKDVTDGNEKWKTGVMVSYWGIISEKDKTSVVSQVIYSNGSYTYINDGTTNMLLYGSNLGLTTGSLISGDLGDGNIGAIYGTLKIYNGLPEFMVSKDDIEFVNKGEGPTPTPSTITIDKLGENLNAYVQIQDAKYVGSDGKTKATFTFKVGDNEFAVYDQWGSKPEFVVDAKYTLKGMGSVYNGTNQLYLISFEKTSDPSGINEMKFQNVLQNGVIYNLAGQKVDNSYKGLIIKNGKKVIQK